MKDTAQLRRRILDRRAVVEVVGQGYVGLSLACAAAKAGFPVIGLDSDIGRIRDLQAGILSVPGVSDWEFNDAVSSGNLTFVADPAEAVRGDVVVITVPTPLRDHVPDLSFVEEAARTVAEDLTSTRLVILESTTYPGTTEELVRPLLEFRGLRVGRDFLLAYSPERIDPGSADSSLRNTPRVVGGCTPECTGVATLFYEQLVDKVVAVSSCRAAELAKLLENTFRHVNIALVNELAMFCNEMNIDVWEVIGAAATKPFGFMPFHPGPGVGGHCIPLDPSYLAWQVRRDADRHFRILEQAQDVNAQMPAYVVGRIVAALNDRGKALKGARVFVLGVSYKADVGDVRESPALRIMTLLRRKGAIVGFNDPHVESLSVDGGSLRSIELTRREVEGADIVAIVTPHAVYDLEWIADHAPLLFDARNAYGADRRANVIRL